MPEVSEEAAQRLEGYSNLVHRLAARLHCEIANIENEIQRMQDRLDANARRKHIADVLSSPA